jgi:AraC-like DNA-binding protein
VFRATKIGGYLRAMQQLGISPKRLLAGTDIDVKRVPDPDYLITLEQYESVVANMMRLTGNPGIAFLLGGVVNVGELGILGYAMLSANSLRQATQVWVQYSNSIVGTPINIETYHDVSPGYELMVTSPQRFGMLHRFETEELLVQGMKLLHDITGIKPLLGKVSLAYPEPPHRSLYEEFCNCPVVFNAPHTVFRILEPQLNAPIKTGNDELFQICAQHCRKVMRSMPESGLLRSKIRSLFLMTPGCLPDIKHASAAFGMSSSNLRRQLEANGQSYQAIKDEFRYDLAREYLRSGHMSAKQAGYLLGFTSPSVFSRAFKAWSGQTIGQFLALEEK